MLREFPPPPNADETSELITKRLTEAKSFGGARETVTVDWNKQPLHVEVIDLPLGLLFFNPATHRVWAQRSHDAEREVELDRDPYSAISQDYLKFLLQAEPANPSRRDPEFDKLKKDLHEFGQNDPGLVTHEGVLVNGNTRAAALRELGVQSMRVGVLPRSFTWADINAVELSLQLRTDRRRDYSYINRLLAMEEQASLGRQPKEIAKEFRIHESTYLQERWILTAIQEQIERSRTSSGTALRLVDFEDDQEKLKELHRVYMKLRPADPDQAELVKETRMTAIVLGFAKTHVRLIDEQFGDKYLRPRLTTQLPDPGEEQESVAIPGLGIALPAASPQVAAARKFNEQVLQAKAIANVSASITNEGERRAANDMVAKTRKAFEEAIYTADREEKVRKRKQLAPERLAEACADIDQCVADLVQARASRTLDEEAFDDAVVSLRNSLRRLAQQAGRGIPVPGDGVAWLLEAASLGGSR